MGIGSSVSGAVKSVAGGAGSAAGGAFGGPLGAILGGVGGSALSGLFGMGQSADMMEFQKEVLKSKHQWEVSDLKKAGLNPILSAKFGSGGASGAMAPMPDFAGGFEKGLNSALKQAQLKLVNAQADSVNADADIKGPKAVMSKAVENILESATRTINSAKSLDVRSGDGTINKNKVGDLFGVPRPQPKGRIFVGPNQYLI